MSTAGSLIPQEVIEGWEAARNFVMLLHRQVRETMCLRVQGLKDRTIARRHGVCMRTVQGRSSRFAKAQAEALSNADERWAPIFMLLVRAVLHTSQLRADERVPIQSATAERELELVWAEAARFLKDIPHAVRSVMALREQGASTARVAKKMGKTLRTIEVRMKKFRQILEGVVASKETEIQAVWLQYALSLQIVLEAPA